MRKYRLIVSILLILVSIGQLAAKNEPRPNIVFMFADDWGYPHAGSYGDKVIKTPNFDTLAREGILFKNAFVPAPSCTPCRTGVLTGQYPWRCKKAVLLQGSSFPMDVQVYTKVLADEGYHVGFTGKVWNPEGSKRWRSKHAPKNGPKGWGSLAGIKYNSKGDVVKTFRDFLADRKGNQPFCFWFGSRDPHRPYAKGSGVKNGIDPSKVELPPYIPDNDVIREDACDYYNEVQRFDKQCGQLISYLKANNLYKNTIIVMSGDHGWPGFPRGKTNLYEWGSHAVLAIHWPGKIKGGRTVDDFVNLTDLAPTYLEAAGLKPLKAMTGKSLMPILNSEESGLIDKSRTFAVYGRERHVATARPERLPYPQRALRTKDWLYIHNFKPERWPIMNLDDEKAMKSPCDIDRGPTKSWLVTHRNDPGVKEKFLLVFGKRPQEELYAIQKDPHSMNNLAYDDKYEAIAKKLREQLMAELKQSKDPRVMGDGSTFDKPPYTGVK